MDGRLLEVTLAKADAMAWWRCVVKGEPEIDVQQVEPESSSLKDLGALGWAGVQSGFGRGWGWRGRAVLAGVGVECSVGAGGVAGWVGAGWVGDCRGGVQERS